MPAWDPKCRETEKVMLSELETKYHGLYFLPSATSLVKQNGLKNSINDESSCCVNEDTKIVSEELAFAFVKTFGFCVPIIF